MPAVTFVSGDVATAAQQNTQDGDISTGLTNTLARDGQAAATADISIGGHKITNLGLGSANSDAANFGQMKSFVPAGVIFPFASATTPAGFLACDGSAVSRTTFAVLFAAIGTIWGVGDGSTTFNLPDCRGRSLVGADNMGTAAGAAGRLTTATVSSTGITGNGGAETNTLDLTMIPAHAHGTNTSGQSVTHNHTYSQGGSPVLVQAGASFTALTATSTVGTGNASVDHTHTITSAGGGLAHNNLQPTLLVLAIIKY